MAGSMREGSKKMLLRTGELGSVNAQRRIGVVFAPAEEGWAKDLDEAARWYRRAAEQGHSE